MSGLAGAFDPSGRPIDRDAFGRVVSRIAYRGRDGIRTLVEPGVAMAFAKFARTPDAVGDLQPLHDPVADTCTTFDGRLDNREELAGRLDIALAPDTCDVSIVAAAYARWGIDCPVHLLGDFSLVIWDRRAHRLFAARDILAERPLFLREWRGAWWWASDQRALVELEMPAINEGFVGEHLSGRVTSIDETIYEGVSRVPMAHALVIGSGGVRRWRYWRPKSARLTYRDGRDYEQHYDVLLGDAVRARLRMPGRAALFLSGGIDSASVASHIARLRDEGMPAAANVDALSMTVPGSPACEGWVIAEVLQRVRLPHEVHPAEEQPAAWFANDASAALDLPHPPSSGTSMPLWHAAAANGRAIVFTGYGGDDWFDTSYAELGDLLRRGRVISFTRRLATMACVPNQTASSELVRLSAWMAMPPSVKRVVRGALRRDPVPAWIDPRFARTTNLADRLRQRPDEVEFPSLLQYDTFRAACSAAAAFARDQEERVSATLGFEQRHPLMDRRLIEFALALPPELRCENGLSKALMRRARLRDLPAAVTTAPRNDDFGFLGLRALAYLGGVTPLMRARPVRRGWIRADVVAALYGELERGATRSLWPLCTMMGVDFWLRALQDAAPPVNHYGQDAFHAAS
jgi:asparagine synthase (glutamine-hydrolysing)